MGKFNIGRKLLYLISICASILLLIYYSSCEGDDDDDAQPTPTAAPNSIQDGIWVMTTASDIDGFSTEDFDIVFCVSADSSKIYIIDFKTEHTHCSLYHSPPLGIEILNNSFFIDDGIVCISAEFKDASSAEGYASIEPIGGFSEENFFWQASIYPRIEGNPHNGMWYGESEEDLPIWFVINKDGDCLVYFCLSVFFPPNSSYSL